MLISSTMGKTYIYIFLIDSTSLGVLKVGVFWYFSETPFILFSCLGVCVSHHRMLFCSTAPLALFSLQTSSPTCEEDDPEQARRPWGRRPPRRRAEAPRTPRGCGVEGWTFEVVFDRRDRRDRDLDRGSSLGALRSLRSRKGPSGALATLDGYLTAQRAGWFMDTPDYVFSIQLPPLSW